MCASIASSLRLRRANARRPLTHIQRRFPLAPTERMEGVEGKEKACCLASLAVKSRFSDDVHLT